MAGYCDAATRLPGSLREWIPHALMAIKKVEEDQGFRGRA
jgi:hypothetical protein